MTTSPKGRTFRIVKPTDSPPDTEETVAAVRGANPFVGLTPGQLANAAVRWAQALARRPKVLAESVGGWAADEARVIVGKSEVKPDPKDRRFADPAWHESPLWRRVVQSYLVTRDSVMGSVDNLDLDA